MTEADPDHAEVASQPTDSSSADVDAVYRLLLARRPSATADSEYEAMPFDALVANLCASPEFGAAVDEVLALHCPPHYHRLDRSDLELVRQWLVDRGRLSMAKGPISWWAALWAFIEMFGSPPGCCVQGEKWANWVHIVASIYDPSRERPAGLLPYLEFEPEWYLKANPRARDAVAAGICPDAQTYFLRFGRQNGDRLLPAFDGNLLEIYAGIEENADTLEPFIEAIAFAAFAGELSHWLFEPRHYLRMRSVAGREPSPVPLAPYVEFLCGGDEGEVSPHPLFSHHAYKLLNDSLGGSCFRHYLREGMFADYSTSPLFGGEFYLQANVEAQTACASGTVLSPLHHFLTQGIYRDAPFSSAFELAWYRRHYRDVAQLVQRNALPSATWHFVIKGLGEDRRPNNYFDPKYYRSIHPEIVEDMAKLGLASTLEHFLLVGEPLADDIVGLENSSPGMKLDRKRLDEIIMAVLRAEPQVPPAIADPVLPPMNFLLYSPLPMSSELLGQPEYSYAFVRHAFLPLLRQMGAVHDVADVQSADAVLAELEKKGEGAVLLSFAPPHRSLVGARCPTIPVVAWEFPTIPSGSADAPHTDWRSVLRHFGRAITLSDFAASAIRSAMGMNFPVVSVPAPVWNRFQHLHSAGPPANAGPIRVRGMVFDTRDRQFEPGAMIPERPEESDMRDRIDEFSLDGIVFTTVFAPLDGRKNWTEIVASFVEANADRPDTTLVLKLVTNSFSLWWWDLHDILNGVAPFLCRVVAVHGYLDQPDFEALISTSHWIVNASSAEGLCLPLVEGMSGGIPAIAPDHTAMADYINSRNALVVASSEEPGTFPLERNGSYVTARHRIAWDTLVAAFNDAYRIVTTLPEDYAALSSAAHESMKALCSDEVVGAKLDSFMGLGLSPPNKEGVPSELLREGQSS